MEGFLASFFFFGIAPNKEACFASDFETTHSSLTKIEKNS